MMESQPQSDDSHRSHLPVAPLPTSFSSESIDVVHLPIPRPRVRILPPTSSASSSRPSTTPRTALSPRRIVVYDTTQPSSSQCETDSARPTTGMTNAVPLIAPRHIPLTDHKSSHHPHLSVSEQLADLRVARGGFWSFQPDGVHYHPETVERHRASVRRHYELLTERSVAKWKRAREERTVTSSRLATSAAPASAPNVAKAVTARLAHHTRTSGTSATIVPTVQRPSTSEGERTALKTKIQTGSNLFTDEHLPGLPLSHMTTTTPGLLHSCYHSSLLPPGSSAFLVPESVPPQPKRSLPVSAMVAADERLAHEAMERAREANGRRFAGRPTRSLDSRTRPSRQHRLRPRPFAGGLLFARADVGDGDGDGEEDEKNAPPTDDLAMSRTRADHFLRAEHTLPLLRGAHLAPDQFNPALAPHRSVHSHAGDGTAFRYDRPLVSQLSSDMEVNAMPFAFDSSRSLPIHESRLAHKLASERAFMLSAAGRTKMKAQSPSELEQMPPLSQSSMTVLEAYFKTEPRIVIPKEEWCNMHPTKTPVQQHHPLLANGEGSDSSRLLTSATDSNTDMIVYDESASTSARLDSPPLPSDLPLLHYIHSTASAQSSRSHRSRSRPRRHRHRHRDTSPFETSQYFVEVASPNSKRRSEEKQALEPTATVNATAPDSESDPIEDPRAAPTSVWHYAVTPLADHLFPHKNNRPIFSSQSRRIKTPSTSHDGESGDAMPIPPPPLPMPHAHRSDQRLLHAIRRHKSKRHEKSAEVKSETSGDSQSGTKAPSSTTSAYHIPTVRVPIPTASSFVTSPASTPSSVFFPSDTVFMTQDSYAEGNVIESDSEDDPSSYEIEHDHVRADESDQSSTAHATAPNDGSTFSATLPTVLSSSTPDYPYVMVSSSAPHSPPMSVRSRRTPNSSPRAHARVLTGGEIGSIATSGVTGARTGERHDRSSIASASHDHEVGGWGVDTLDDDIDHASQQPHTLQQSFIPAPDVPQSSPSQSGAPDFQSSDIRIEVPSTVSSDLLVERFVRNEPRVPPIDTTALRTSNDESVGVSPPSHHGLTKTPSSASVSTVTSTPSVKGERESTPAHLTRQQARALRRASLSVTPTTPSTTSYAIPPHMEQSPMTKRGSGTLAQSIYAKQKAFLADITVTLHGRLVGSGGGGDAHKRKPSKSTAPQRRASVTGPIDLAPSTPSVTSPTKASKTGRPSPAPTTPSVATPTQTNASVAPPSPSPSPAIAPLESSAVEPSDLSSHEPAPAPVPIPVPIPTVDDERTLREARLAVAREKRRQRRLLKEGGGIGVTPNSDHAASDGSAALEPGNQTMTSNVPTELPSQLSDANLSDLSGNLATDATIPSSVAAAAAGDDSTTDRHDTGDDSSAPSSHRRCSSLTRGTKSSKASKSRKARSKKTTKSRSKRMSIRRGLQFVASEDEEDTRAAHETLAKHSSSAASSDAGEMLDGLSDGCAQSSSIRPTSSASSASLATSTVPVADTPASNHSTAPIVAVVPPPPPPSTVQTIRPNVSELIQRRSNLKKTTPKDSTASSSQPIPSTSTANIHPPPSRKNVAFNPSQSLSASGEDYILALHRKRLQQSSEHETAAAKKKFVAPTSKRASTGVPKGAIVQQQQGGSSNNNSANSSSSTSSNVSKSTRRSSTGLPPNDGDALSHAPVQTMDEFKRAHKHQRTHSNGDGHGVLATAASSTSSGVRSRSAKMAASLRERQYMDEQRQSMHAAELARIETIEAAEEKKRRIEEHRHAHYERNKSAQVATTNNVDMNTDSGAQDTAPSEDAPHGGQPDSSPVSHADDAPSDVESADSDGATDNRSLLAAPSVDPAHSSSVTATRSKHRSKSSRRRRPKSSNESSHATAAHVGRRKRRAHTRENSVAGEHENSTTDESQPIDDTLTSPPLPSITIDTNLGDSLVLSPPVDSPTGFVEPTSIPLAFDADGMPILIPLEFVETVVALKTLKADTVEQDGDILAVDESSTQLLSNEEAIPVIDSSIILSPPVPSSTSPSASSQPLLTGDDLAASLAAASELFGPKVIQMLREEDSDSSANSSPSHTPIGISRRSTMTGMSELLQRPLYHLKRPNETKMK